MTSLCLPHLPSGWAASVGLLLAASVSILPGCNKSASKTASTAPSGSAAGVAAGPCATYSQKICDKAGLESPTCASFKTAVELMTPATCQAGLKDVDHSFKQLTTLRGPCDALVAQLCAAVGPKSEACTMVTTQTKQFPIERCKAMLESIPQITTDLKRMEAAKQPLSPELTSKIAKGPVPSLGPENAAVQIVEFSDFECPFCSRAADVVHQIREKYGDKVRIVFRQFPLEMHPNAQIAAQASLAANEQGKFWNFHDTLFKNQRALDRNALDGHAKQSGLDLAMFKKSLDDKKFEAQVKADMKLGEEVSVQGTPSMFINGKRVENPTDLATVTGIIDGLLGGAPPG